MSKKFSHILHMEISTSLWTKITQADLCEISSPCLIFFMNLPDVDLPKIRRVLKLHPLVDQECSSSSLNMKDQVLKLPDSLLITVSDLNIVNDVEHPISYKVLFSPRFILIFSNDALFSLDAVYGLNQYMYDYREPRLPIDFDNTEIEILNQSSTLESVLFTLIDITFQRLEIICKLFEQEIRQISAQEDSQDKSLHKLRLSALEQKITRLNALVSSKQDLISDIAGYQLIEESVYFDETAGRAEDIVIKLESCREMVEKTEAHWLLRMERAQTEKSQKLDNLDKVFGTMGIIFLPSSLFMAMVSVNVTMPMLGNHGLYPFMLITGGILSYTVFSLIYFKLISSHYFPWLFNRAS